MIPPDLAAALAAQLHGAAGAMPPPDHPAGPALAAMLAGHLRGPEPDGGGPENGPAGKGLPQLQDAIQAVHQAISALPDPMHTQMASQALAILTRVQRELMQPQPGNAATAVAGQLKAQ